LRLPGKVGRLPLGCVTDIVSDCRRQAWIEAPIEIVWALVRDVNRHPEWWPRVVEVECEGLEEGCTYRQVTQSPFGYQELDVVVDRLDELRELRIRCTNTGTFVDLALTPAGTGTFVDARFGMDPATVRLRLFDAVAGKRYFRRWLEQSLDAMQRVAHRQAGSMPLS
jgi:Polyketide cyclase / dehydrase and lipid transport